MLPPHPFWPPRPLPFLSPSLVRADVSTSAARREQQFLWYHPLRAQLADLFLRLWARQSQSSEADQPLPPPEEPPVMMLPPHPFWPPRPFPFLSPSLVRADVS